MSDTLTDQDRAAAERMRGLLHEMRDEEPESTVLPEHEEIDGYPVEQLARIAQRVRDEIGV